MRVGPAFWLGICWYLSTIVVFAITLNLYGSWLVSIGLAVVWWIFYIVQVTPILTRLKMPINTWKALVQRFPRTVKVNQENADSVGLGTLNDLTLSFALVARNDTLSVRIFMVRFLWRDTITVPWNQIDIQRVGTNPEGDYVAVVSFPEFPDCELVLPWRKKFARFHDRAQPGSLPAERGPKTG